MIQEILRGPLLLPRRDRTVTYIFDGALAIDDLGKIAFSGAHAELVAQLGADAPAPRASNRLILPPFLDIHTHIPQHPIRGRFVEGVPRHAPEGRLLAGLKRNVFPAEARFAELAYAEQVTREFLADTLASGVVGGVGWMTVHARAVARAMSILPPTWSIGFVQMSQNCPENLRTDDENFESDVSDLATRFGRRVVLSDRFAVAVPTPLRHRLSDLADQFGLRTQTHLNEQVAEKRFVEESLYPGYDNYTDVYRRDGLLDHHAIAAHCIHMREPEYRILVEQRTSVAHCPTSNRELGSGVMDIESMLDWDIPFALATDVGASPTTSMLAEMRVFLEVHKDLHASATPREALYRATLAPAEILFLTDEFGTLDAGMPASFIEVEPAKPCDAQMSADAVIEHALIDGTVRSVRVRGKILFPS